MKRTHLQSLAALGRLAVLAAALPGALRGQTPGDRVQVSYDLPFSSHGQSMWGPADAPAALDFTVTLFDESWSEGGTANGVFPLAGFDWGGSFTGNTSGRVGLFFRISDIGTGAVNLDYPVRVVLDVPAPNSFRDGDVVTIGSRFEVLPGWNLSTEPPGGALTVSGVFRAHLDASGRVCFFGCPPPGTLVNLTVPNTPFELFSVTSTGSLTLPVLLPPPLPRPLVIETLPYQFGGVFDLFGPALGLSGPVDGPRVTTTATLGGDGRTLTAFGQHRFVDVTLDLDHYLNLLFPLIPPFSFQTNSNVQLVTGATFGYTFEDWLVPFSITQQQTFTFQPRVTITAGFPVALDFVVLNASGTVSQTGHGATASFEVGQQLQVTMPSGPREPLPGTPTYGLANTFDSSTDFVFNERLTVTAGEFSLHTPSATVTREFTETVCSIFGIDAIELICRAAGGVLETVTRTVSEAVPPANIELGPLLNAHELVNLSQTLPLFPTGDRVGHWQLAGLQTFTENPFVLDPEDPRIAVATDLASAQLAAGGPPGAILQTVRLRNDGDVPLSAAELRDALTALVAGGPFQVLNVSSPTLTTDPAFDGAASPGLLAGGNALPIGAEAVVTVTLGVAPGSIYRADVRAAGTSPIGTAVAAEAAAALGVVAFEIIPDQISAWSNGMLPARIRSQGLSAGQVDPASVLLEGAAPSQWNLTSSGDLILKFPLQEVLSALDQRLLSQVSIVAATAALRAGEATAAPAAPAVTLADVVAAVLGERARLDPAAIAVVDRAGNGNGALDLGDLRALVVSRQVESGAGWARVGSSVAAAVSDLRNLVVTGSLGDGTRFIGEDDLAVLNGGQ